MCVKDPYFEIITNLGDTKPCQVKQATPIFTDVANAAVKIQAAY